MLAGLLQPTYDRIGVVVSQSRKSGSDHCCTLLSSLQRVDLEQLQRVLTNLEQIPTYGSPMRDTVQAPLDFCANILRSASRQSTEQFNNTSRVNVEEALQHIFLVTAVPVCYLKAERDDLQVHVINPGFIPWQRPPVGISGWQLHLPGGSVPGAYGRSSKPLQVLERAVESARLGASLGQLTELSVDISAAGGANVESVLGKTDYESLRPGQIARLLVRVKPGRAASAELRPGPIPTVPGLAISSEEVLTELDTLLGEKVEQLLQVQVRYKHTLLPRDTMLFTKKPCTIKRHASDSTWTRHLARSTPSGHHRLARYDIGLGEFIASTHDPVHALATLEALYDDDGRIPTVPTPIRHNLQELRHRLVVNKELNAAHQDQVQSAFPAYYAQKEHVANGTLCEDQFTSTPSSQSPTSPRQEPEQDERVPTGTTSNDEAHRIWSEMRKMLKPTSNLAVIPGSPISSAPQNLTGMVFVSSPTSLMDPTATTRTSAPTKISEEEKEKQHRVREIAAQAVRNKRSVGAETLRSLAFGGTTRDSDSIAPWL